MFAFERVLAPIDLRGDFEQRAQYAVDIAAALEAELTLLHVVNSRRIGKRNRGLSWPECAMTRTNPPCAVHRAVVHGEVPDAVARYAAFVDASLIVLSGGRRPPWKRLWGGSMTQKIVEATSKPVLVGKPVLAGNLGRAGRPRLKSRPRILCMLDLSAEDRVGETSGLVEYAQSLAEQSGGDLVLYAAASRANEEFLFNRAGSRQRPLSAEAATDRLNRMGASLRVPHRSVVTTRPPHSGLRAAIRQHEVDLVLALRSDRDGIPGAGFEFGALLRSVSCPLLSITSHSLPPQAANHAQARSETAELATQGG